MSEDRVESILDAMRGGEWFRGYVDRKPHLVAQYAAEVIRYYANPTGRRAFETPAAIQFTSATSAIRWCFAQGCESVLDRSNGNLYQADGTVTNAEKELARINKRRV